MKSPMNTKLLALVGPRPVRKAPKGPEGGSTRGGCTSFRAMARNIRRARAGR